MREAEGQGALETLAFKATTPHFLPPTPCPKCHLKMTLLKIDTSEHSQVISVCLSQSASILQKIMVNIKKTPMQSTNIGQGGLVLCLSTLTLDSNTSPEVIWVSHNLFEPQVPYL